MRTWGRGAAILFCLAILLTGWLFGREKNERKVVRIPSTNFNRLMMVDEDGNPVSGYAYDYIQAIGTYARWDVEYVPCDNFSDCVKKLLSGEVDLFYDISYTPERAEMILFPDEPMGNEYYYLYSRGNNTSVIPGDYSSMRGKSVGVTSGTMQIERWPGVKHGYALRALPLRGHCLSPCGTEHCD